MDGPIHPLVRGKAYVAALTSEEAFFADVGHFLYEAYIHEKRRDGKRVQFNEITSEVFDQVCQYLATKRFAPTELPALIEKIQKLKRNNPRAQQAIDTAQFIIEHARTEEQLVTIMRRLLRPIRSFGSLRKFVTRRMSGDSKKRRRKLRTEFDRAVTRPR